MNRKELARRIARRGHYDIGETEEMLKHFEDVLVEALENDEQVKMGKVFKAFLQTLPKKRAWDGLNEKYFTREPKKVPKFKPLTRLESIELPVHNTEDEDGE